MTVIVRLDLMLLINIVMEGFASHIVCFFVFGSCDSVNFLPLKAYQTDMVVLLDTKNQKILKVVDLRPW